MFDVCVRLFCVCVVPCLGSGLTTNLSLVQGVLPSVKNDYKTEEARVVNGLEEQPKKILSLVPKLSLFKTISYEISLFEF
jgi:hypothetical protein